MRILTQKIFPDTNLFLSGDIHWGSRMHHEEGFEMFGDILHSKYDGLPSTRNFAASHGDIMEGIAIDDKRFNPNITDPNILGVMDYAVKKYKKISKKMVVELDGNHTRKLWRTTGNPDEGVAFRICRDAGVPFGGFSCTVKYVDQQDRLIFRHYLRHGKKSITSTADDPKRALENMQLILKRHLKGFRADCALMSKGHNHLLLYNRPMSALYLHANEEDELKQAYTETDYVAEYIHPDYRHYIGSGCFRKSIGDGFDDYSEIGEYAPTELGFWCCKIRDRVIVGMDKIVLSKITAEQIEVDVAEEEVNIEN